ARASASRGPTRPPQAPAAASPRGAAAAANLGSLPSRHAIRRPRLHMRRLGFGAAGGALAAILALALLAIAVTGAFPPRTRVGVPLGAATRPAPVSLETTPAAGSHIVAIDPGHGGSD